MLRCLILLLEVLKQHLLTKSEDALTLISHQLLKRIALARVALRPFTGIIKPGLYKQMDSLLQSGLINTKVLPYYELFLDHLQVEDTKALVNNESSIHVVLNTLSDIIGSECEPVVTYVLTQFFTAFLTQCDKDHHRLLMLATLFYMVDVSVPGPYSVDSNSPLHYIVDTTKVDSNTSEAVVDCLVKCLQSFVTSCRGHLFITYLKSFLVHQMENIPKTHNGIHAVQTVLHMYPVEMNDILHEILGSLMVWQKTEKMYEVYQRLLLLLLRKYSGVQNPSELISVLFNGILFSKNSLRSHRKFLPAPVCAEAITQKPAYSMLPNR